MRARAARPVVARPVVARPVVARPVVARPVVARPVVARPVVARLILAPLFVASLALGACGLPTKEQRVQEAAYELNMGLRFSRSDIALQKVMRTERARFTERHKRWHGDIKIVDIELAGVAFREDGDAQMFLSVSWQRADQQDMRMTTITQRWHDKQGTWMLSAEERAGGDFGLFGDVAPLVPGGGDDKASARGDMQFRTTTIRAAD